MQMVLLFSFLTSEVVNGGGSSSNNKSRGGQTDRRTVLRGCGIPMFIQREIERWTVGGARVSQTFYIPFEREGFKSRLHLEYHFKF